MVWFHYVSPTDTDEFGKLYWKMKNNLSQEEAMGLFEDMWTGYLAELHAGDEASLNDDDQVSRMSDGDCPCLLECIHKWTAKKNLMPCLNVELSGWFGGMTADQINFIVGFYSGLLDGVLENVYFLADAGAELFKLQDTLIDDILSVIPSLRLFFEGAKFVKIVRKAIYDGFYSVFEWGPSPTEQFKNTVIWYKDSVEILRELATNWKTILENMISGLTEWLNNVSGRSGTQLQGYAVGKVVLELLLGVVTGGASMTASAVEAAGLRMKALLLPIRSGGVKDTMTGLWNGIKNTADGVKCRILHSGCFVKNTPVLVDRNAISKSGRVYALAAGLPFMAMPIQEVPLLSWSVANETVNEQNNLIASTDEDLYMGLLDGDPYTSPQQKQRDEYELNDSNWYSISFEQVDGTSKCHFALHDDWIKRQGYEIEKVVTLNLPEQGINGPFRVTAVKHIIPQKKPTEDAGDGYDWKPVTGLFEHQSNQVYDISFDNGEELGVTYQHPIYSTTTGGWRLAGELEIGEEVLTKSGNTKVVSSTKKEGLETVYNLEVKELHNFLVAESGVVVHNNYNVLQSIIDGIHNATKQFHKKYMCKEYGTALRQHLIQNGESNPKAVIYRLFDGNGNRVQMRIYHNGEEIATNGLHVGTPINGKMYDNMNPNGMDLDEWLSKFEYPPHLTLKPDIIDASQTINSFY